MAEPRSRLPTRLHIGPWLPGEADLASLKELCERANRMEGRTSALPSGGLPLSQLLERYTDPGGARLLAEAARHPIYRHLAQDVPRIRTAPPASPLIPCDARG
jgi:hypothetical protein